MLKYAEGSNPVERKNAGEVELLEERKLILNRSNGQFIRSNTLGRGYGYECKYIGDWRIWKLLFCCFFSSLPNPLPLKKKQIRSASASQE